MNLTSLNQKISNYAKNKPQKIAIEYGNDLLTYGEMVANSNRISNFLGKHYGDVKNVLLLMESSPRLIEAILGVMNSNGVFVPIDPNFPANRISLMVEEVQGEWIISQYEWLAKLDEITRKTGKKLKVLLLGENTRDLGDYPNLEIYTMDAQALEETEFEFEDKTRNCYIYFTSGSTGKPKGILGRHRSLSHFIEWEAAQFGVNEEFKVSQFTSPSFDPFLRDIFLPLSCGATLCIPESREIIYDPRKMRDWIETRQINLIHMVPSLFKVLMSAVDVGEAFKGLKYIMLAGEMLRGNDVKKFLELFEERIKIVNLYGPTETTLAKFYHVVGKEDAERTNIPVGKPISFTEALILDSNMKHCQTGNIGEVYIRTPFISSGYYNQKELTQKVFIKNPYGSHAGDILYKTGDLGRMMPDRNLEIIGRADHQVKIRGIRIELGEIENRILSYASVKEAVVIARENEDGTKYLCAYFVSGEEIGSQVLSAYLSDELPDYMIPSYFTRLECMPLTPNGKVNRMGLPEPDKRREPTGEYVGPSSEVEKEVAGIWEKVLKTENIGVHDNFFEIGGNSLLLIQVHTILEESYPGRIKVTDLFNYPTIAKLAELLSADDTGGSSIYVDTVPMPEEYFDNEGDSGSVIRLEICKDEIDYIAKLEGVSCRVVLLGVYYYLYSQITEEKKITLQVAANIENRVTNMELNLGNLDSFSALFKEVEEKRKNDKTAYYLDSVNQLKLNSNKSSSVLPLFYEKSLINHSMNLLSVYDIVVEITYTDEKIGLLCDYNSTRLNGYRVEELIDSYYQLIKDVAQEYKVVS
ncbi:MAG: non-ribosomal peptide synthetase [Clostridia bacterium]|nr:non-ribosomal peptide synthetase [Clostridia bacterium]